jgi:hypothetical protein
MFGGCNNGTTTPKEYTYNLTLGTRPVVLRVSDTPFSETEITAIQTALTEISIDNDILIASILSSSETLTIYVDGGAAYNGSKDHTLDSFNIHENLLKSAFVKQALFDALLQVANVTFNRSRETVRLAFDRHLGRQRA